MDTHEPTEPPRRPRGELFAHPEASLVWAAIESLDPGMRHALYDALGDHVAVPEAASSPHERRISRAVAALREAAEMLAAEGQPRLVSMPAYRRLRDENPELGWPPDSSIRRWMGGRWNDALRRAQLQPVADGDMLVAEIGPTLTRDEIIEALQDYAEDTGNYTPTLARYLAWARRPDVKRRPGRRPQSQGPFDRLFGSWSAAVDRALNTDALAAARAASPRTSLVARARYRYSDAEIHEALQFVAGRLGRSPKVVEYKMERSLVLEADLAAGQPLHPLPSNNLIQQRYPTWDEALEAAGLEPTNGRHNKIYGAARRSSKRITDEEILAAIRLARQEIKGRLTIRAYQEWRRETVAADEAAGVFRKLPEHFCIWQRFGGWSTAVERALTPVGEAPAEDDAPEGEPDPAADSASLMPAAAAAAAVVDDDDNGLALRGEDEEEEDDHDDDDGDVTAEVAA